MDTKEESKKEKKSKIRIYKQINEQSDQSKHMLEIGCECGSGVYG